MNNGYSFEYMLENENTSNKEKVEILYNYFKEMDFLKMTIVLKAMEKLSKEVA